ncbi:MAG: hypothetical protein HY701_13955 [Gemmatimonadetes bacterium]|nr:hypothetical protein [Gemmatimonadota bacterium]
MPFRQRLSSTLGRVIARLQGEPSVHPRGTAPSFLAAAFRDLSVRRDLDHFIAAFDPSNLRLYIDGSSEFIDERRLIRRGELDEAKRLIQARLPTMDAETQVEYAFVVTNEIHELRHVHDYFGTAAGFDRFVQTLKDGVAFYQLWERLVERRAMKLPLTEWAKDAAAPQELRDYMAGRERYIASLRTLQAPIAPFGGGGASNSDFILLYHGGGFQAIVPTVTINLASVKSGKPLHKVVPLGLHAVMEGTASFIQRQAVKRLFGDEHVTRATRVLSGGPSGDDQWLYYLVIDHCFMEAFKVFFIPFALALCDLAMMPGRGESGGADSHPGVRLRKAIGAAQRVGAIGPDSETRLSDYMEQITQACGWDSPQEVIRQRLERMERLLSGDRDPSVWGRLLNDLANSHRRCLEIRKEFPDVFAEPEFYFTALSRLPESPVFIEGHHIEFRGRDVDDAASFRWWFMFEHFQRQLLFDRTLPCPLAAMSHPCPPDHLASDGQASSACDFAQFLSGIDLHRIAVETL